MRPAVEPPTRETLDDEPAPARAPEVQALVEAALARVHAFASDSAARMPAAVVRELRVATHPEVQVTLLLHALNVALAFGDSLEDVACSALLQAGFADAALAALRANAACAAVVTAGFLTLERLAALLPLDTRMALLRAAVEALSGCADGSGSCARSPEAAAAAAMVVHTTCMIDETFGRVARSAGAPAALIAALLRHPHNEEVQADACNALHSVLGSNGPRDLPERLVTGALDAVVAAMRAFPASAHLQRVACVALGALIVQHSGMQHYAAHAGAVTLLAAALGAHAADADACEAVCFALNHLVDAFRSSDVPAQDAQAAAYTTVATLLAHPAHAPTQEYGVRVLGYMCRHTALLPRIVSSHALHAVLAAMRAHPDNLFVQSSCCVTLVSMLKARHRSAALAEGAAPAVLHALRASCGRAAEGVAQRADYRQRYREGPKAYAVAAIHTLFGTRQGDAPLVAEGEALDALLALLHGGALGLLQQAPAGNTDTDDADDAEERREELVVMLCQLAVHHVSECPDCTDCAALRARGEMCGRAGCVACAPASGGGQLPWRRMGRMQKCARCMTAAYCCKAHQTEAWRAHKKACTAAAARREAAAAQRAGAPQTQ
jgi:hypothetical protein